jgi:hypothetical protein
LPVAPSLDVRGVSTDVLTVAWILDQVEAWTHAAGAGTYRVTVPSTPEVAEQLTAMGTSVTGVVDARAPEELTGAIRQFLERPRISVLVDAESSDRGTALAIALNRSGLRASVLKQAAWDTPAAQCVEAVVTVTNRAEPRLKVSHLNIRWRPESLAAADGADAHDVVLSGSSVDDVAAAVVRSLAQTPGRRAAAGEAWRPTGSLPT